MLGQDVDVALFLDPLSMAFDFVDHNIVYC